MAKQPRLLPVYTYIGQQHSIWAASFLAQHGVPVHIVLPGQSVPPYSLVFVDRPATSTRGRCVKMIVPDTEFTACDRVVVFGIRQSPQKHETNPVLEYAIIDCYLQLVTCLNYNGNLPFHKRRRSRRRNRQEYRSVLSMYEALCSRYARRFRWIKTDEVISKRKLLMQQIKPRTTAPLGAVRLS